jgi:hypothetical protein
MPQPNHRGHGGYSERDFGRDIPLGLTSDERIIEWHRAHFVQPASLPILDVQAQVKGLYGVHVPVALLEESDCAVILRPENQKRYHDANIYLTNKPMLIKPDRYVVLPYVAAFYEQYLASELAEYDPCGESTDDGGFTYVYDWTTLRAKIGIGYTRREFVPWHLAIELGDLVHTPNQEDEAHLYYPAMVSPYSIHRQAEPSTYRRNIKITQATVALAMSFVDIESIDRRGNVIDTVSLALNAGKKLTEEIVDGFYFRVHFHTQTTIYNNLNLYIG